MIHLWRKLWIGLFAAAAFLPAMLLILILLAGDAVFEPRRTARRQLRRIWPVLKMFVRDYPSFWASLPSSRAPRRGGAL